MKTAQWIFLSLLTACSGQKASETSKEVSASSPSVYVLDSLLSFDSEEALIDRFGAQNIARDTAWLPEGMGQIMVTVLYPDTRNEVTFEWSDSASYSTLDAVTVSTDSSEWISNGVKVGTDLMQLIELNGGDFTFSGFGWDYGGHTSFGDDGQLRGIAVILESSEKMMTQDQQDSLIGDRVVSSRSTAARLNNPSVRTLRLVKERD
jgi:hypothetical protein